MGWERVKYLPFLMSFPGIGLPSTTPRRCGSEALLNQQSGFARTPKTGAEGKAKAVKAVKKTYRGSKTR